MSGWLLLEVVLNPGVHRQWGLVFGPARSTNIWGFVASVELYEDADGRVRIDPASDRDLVYLGTGNFDYASWPQRVWAVVERSRKYVWWINYAGPATPTPAQMAQINLAASEYFAKTLPADEYRIFTEVLAAGGRKEVSHVVWGGVAHASAVGLGALAWAYLARGELVRWRAWWRRRRNRCGSCGYDLDGVAGECPECGTAVVPAVAAGRGGRD